MCGNGVTEGEVQINLESMLAIKNAPGAGHQIFNFARSLRAYDPATYVARSFLVWPSTGSIDVRFQHGLR